MNANALRLPAFRMLRTMNSRATACVATLAAAATAAAPAPVAPPPAEAAPPPLKRTPNGL